MSGCLLVVEHFRVDLELGRAGRLLGQAVSADAAIYLVQLAEDLLDHGGQHVAVAHSPEGECELREDCHWVGDCAVRMGMVTGPAEAGEGIVAAGSLDMQEKPGCSTRCGSGKAAVDDRCVACLVAPGCGPKLMLMVVVGLVACGLRCRPGLMC